MKIIEKTKKRRIPKRMYVLEAEKGFRKLSYDESDPKVQSFLKIIQRRRRAYDRLAD
ncbi:MAG: hypothetical protein PWQ84_1008 [Thermotogaceae bacterium]|jgi:hypothetical protein|nr:hypothetical protein [Thermotogaceae bacterium]